MSLLSEDAQGRRKSRLDSRRIQQDQDLRDVLSTDHGRRFVWRLLDEMAGAFSPSFAGSDTHRTAFLEGLRSVGLELMAEAKRVDVKRYGQMLGEQLNAAEVERLIREKEAEETDD